MVPEIPKLHNEKKHTLTNSTMEPLTLLPSIPHSLLDRPSNGMRPYAVGSGGKCLWTRGGSKMLTRIKGKGEFIEVQFRNGCYFSHPSGFVIGIFASYGSSPIQASIVRNWDENTVRVWPKPIEEAVAETRRAYPTEAKNLTVESIFMCLMDAEMQSMQNMKSL